MKNSIMFIQKSIILFSVFCLVGLVTNAKVSSAHVKYSSAVTFGDEIKVIKIKGPSYRMFKKADLEIHKNMLNDINTSFEIKIDDKMQLQADEEMNQLFNEDNIAFFSRLCLDASDAAINHQFFTEQ